MRVGDSEASLASSAAFRRGAAQVLRSEERLAEVAQ